MTIQRAVEARRPSWTARLRCKDGDHTLELHDRELVAERAIWQKAGMLPDEHRREGLIVG